MKWPWSSWQFYKDHEAAFRIIVDALFIALFVYMGIAYQPEIIYVCNQTANIGNGIGVNLSINTSYALNIS